MLQRIRRVRAGEPDQGFTLTELLITIVILGVLAAIVVFAVGAFSDDGKSAACKTDRKNVEIAVDAYYAKNSHYPVGTADTSDSRLQVLVDNKYLKQKPSGTGYVIDLSSAGVVTGHLTDASSTVCA